MGTLISFMHISLDGFVAGPNGEMNWIKVDEELFDHIGKRISKGNTAMYGRTTYEMMEAYWPTAGNGPDASSHDVNHSRWYNGARKLVLSTTLKVPDSTNTEVLGNNLPERLYEVKSRANQEILLFGSPTATHSLMQLNAIDGYWLFVNPVILGRGIPLFSNIENRINLKQLTTRSFTSGVTELNYLVDKP